MHKVAEKERLAEVARKRAAEKEEEERLKKEEAEAAEQARLKKIQDDLGSATDGEPPQSPTNAPPVEIPDPEGAGTPDPNAPEGAEGNEA